MVNLVFLLLQILLSQATAAMAVAILLRISSEQLPSLDRVAPKYLKLLTSSSSLWFAGLKAIDQNLFHY